MKINLFIFCLAHVSFIITFNSLLNIQALISDSYQKRLLGPGPLTNLLLICRFRNTSRNNANFKRFKPHLSDDISVTINP